MSTSITATSSLADVLLAASKISPSTSGWKELDPPTGVTTWTATVGLFGEDLTNFFKDCATVGYSECNPANFAAFSGWAIGTEISVTTDLANGA